MLFFGNQSGQVKRRNLHSRKEICPRSSQGNGMLGCKLTKNLIDLNHTLGAVTDGALMDNTKD